MDLVNTIDKSVMTIFYDKEDELKSASGLFSFSVYTSQNGFNKNITEQNVNMKSTSHRFSQLYFAGILNYTEMVRIKPEWSGWKVVIHTDDHTVSNNPEAFALLTSKGAILGITTLLGRYSNFERFKGIFRISRYYPLFLENLTAPILIRDADTTYEAILATMLQDKYKSLRHLKGEDFILSDFITKLSTWEHKFLQKILPFGNKVVFSYDENYGFPVKPTNTISSMKYTGADANLLDNDMELARVRFLAGNVSKVGNPLPIELWERDLPNYLWSLLPDEKLYEAFVRYNKPHIFTSINNFITIADEKYLTDVIYKWCKEHDYAEFFKLNYVTSFRNEDFYKRYFQTKQSGKKSAKRGLTFEINPAQLSETNRRTYNSVFLLPAALPEKTKEFIRHKTKEKVILNNPEFALQNNFFFNPLTRNLKEKPWSLPSYYFGGTRKRRLNRRKSRKA